ncbi:MAG: gliding motility lipoprotein GldD [Paludibacteraceae bacterium]|nr:gliding motility lipoprotein GldD [Paludibacteraceae bacterium]
MRKLLLLLPLFLLLAACRKPAVPKERGYFRIDLEQPVYTDCQLDGYPYHFLINQAATPQAVEYDGEQYWIDIFYPAFNAFVHCSYKPVKGNLRQLSDDAQEFVFNHAVKATAIPEHEYSNPEAHTYGILYELEGNTASPTQFYLTDSVRHFFRGAVYVNCIPNQDSLAPVYDYLHQDVLMLIETLRWTDYE